MKWSAGWGAACDACARAKTRCISSQQESGSKSRCTRCQDLDIPCAPQVRKPRKKRRTQTESVRLDSATPQPTHIYGQSNSPSGSIDPLIQAHQTGATKDNGRRSTATDSGTNAYVAQVKPDVAGAFSAHTYLPGFHPFPRPTCTCILETDGNDDMEAVASDEDLLSIYRTRLSPQFPFVIIHDGLTAADLQRSRPFLAKTIRMVASIRDRRSMWKQSKPIMQHIANAVFMGPDKSLDLLQGIIVFLGFYHYFCFAHRHFNNLVHLASSTICDMRLDRARAKPPKRKFLIGGLDPEEPKEFSYDEKRAILAVWYINSSAAVAYNRVNSSCRHFTKHMERCLQDLQNNPECDTDAAIVQLIYAQRINEMIGQSHQADQTVDVASSTNVWVANLDRLLADLGGLRGSEGRYKSHSHLVTSHYNLALLQLLEPQLLDKDSSRKFETIAALQNTPDYFHSSSTSAKDAADIALRAWFEDWLKIPVCHLFYLPLSALLQLTSATTILLRRSRLTLLSRHRLQEPPSSEMDAGNASSIGPDAGNIADDLMLDLLERLASRFEAARVEMAASLCLDWENDLFDLIAWKIRERKTCLEKWMKIISTEVQSSALRGIETGAGPWLDGIYGVAGDSAPGHSPDDMALWFDPLEALLLGTDAYDS